MVQRYEKYMRPPSNLLFSKIDYFDCVNKVKSLKDLPRFPNLQQIYLELMYGLDKKRKYEGNGPIGDSKNPRIVRSEAETQVGVSQASDDDDEFQLFPGIKSQLPKVSPEKLVSSADKQLEEVQSKKDELDDPEIEDDEEGRFVKTASSIPIPGTSIVLETEEDIAKWIAERRKNWPTNKRTQEKMSTQTPVTAKRQERVPKICRFFAQTGKCKNGQNCKMLHERRENASNHSSTIRPLKNYKLGDVNGITIQIPLRYAPSANTGKSLHNLLAENEILRDQNGTVLKVIEKLVNSGVVTKDWESLTKNLRLKEKR
ncbi:unnamed protein product [Kuraishia capsulata CBS 1993]|uniref:C3H1-type domain-containing protein n=1 Tax=Kuraishia capsulata CBS 1993 TaxID=1382522 RepID=W6MNT7_9ASCO|nr:uncharacterized protein KUCA_T00004316001 [Kuraishia capsulata CBS 1993]CDK28334.1 unnamed protein product [Kuraishia capsulata CBS 1993]